MIDKIMIRRRASAILRGNGWVRKRLRGPSGGFCLLGALQEAAKRTTGDALGELYHAAVADIVDELGKASLSRWNDARHRREAQVHALLLGKPWKGAGL